jgi:hypothetical protein
MLGDHWLNICCVLYSRTSIYTNCIPVDEVRTQQDSSQPPVMAYNASCTPVLAPTALLNENMYFTGMFLSNIAYGATVALGLQCLVLLRSTVAGSPRARRLWSAIVLFILVSGTFAAATGHIYQKIAFIAYRDFPGGPSTWILILLVFSNLRTNTTSYYQSGIYRRLLLHSIDCHRFHTLHHFKSGMRWRISE